MGFVEHLIFWIFTLLVRVAMLSLSTLLLLCGKYFVVFHTIIFGICSCFEENTAATQHVCGCLAEFVSLVVAGCALIGGGPNVALNKEAYQISTSHQGVPGRAVGTLLSSCLVC